MKSALLLLTFFLHVGIVVAQDIIIDKSSARDNQFINSFVEQSGHQNKVDHIIKAGEGYPEVMISSVQSGNSNDSWKLIENGKNLVITSHQSGDHNMVRQRVMNSENMHVSAVSEGSGNESMQDIEDIRALKNSEIYIKQKGQNNIAYQVITGNSKFITEADAGIEQSGYENYSAQEIRGGDFRVFAYQLGSMNSSFIMVTGRENLIKSMQLGDQNRSEIRVKGTGNSMVPKSEMIEIPEELLKGYDGKYLQSQFGINNVSKLIIEGSNNRTAQYQYSDIMYDGNNMSLISIEGDDNLALEIQAGMDNTAEVSIKGDRNITLLSQRDQVNDARWNESFVSINGDGNSVEVIQSGIGNKSDAQLSGYNNQVRNIQR